jgi:integrase
MGETMATIRRRGSRWQVQIRRQGFPPFSKSFVEKADALRWARSQEVAIDRGENLKAVDVRLITLSEVFTRYEAEVSSHKRSPSDHSHLRQLSRHALGRTAIHALTTELVASFRDERLKAVSGSTVRKELNLLAHVLKVARIDWNVPVRKDLVSDVTKPPSGKSRTRRVTESELTRLIEALSRCRNPLIAEIFLFALATGMRRGEILRLSWENVSWTQRTAFLPLTKNGDSRTVPLSPNAIKVLERRRSQAGTDVKGHVFPMSANAVRMAWVRALSRAKIYGLRFHDLRHEAISSFFELGLSVPEVALISGHKDARMLFRYTHLKAEAVANKLEKLDAESSISDAISQ